MGGGGGPGSFQFVKKENRADGSNGGGGDGDKHNNVAARFAGKALRSESAMADGQDLTLLVAFFQLNFSLA